MQLTCALLVLSLYLRILLVLRCVEFLPTLTLTLSISHEYILACVVQYDTSTSVRNRLLGLILRSLGIPRLKLDIEQGLMGEFLSMDHEAVKIFAVASKALVTSNWFRVYVAISLHRLCIFLQWGYDRLLALESVLRQSLTDLESEILEGRLPITVEVNEDGEEVPVNHRRP